MTRPPIFLLAALFLVPATLTATKASAQQVVADFDDLTLAADSHWNGPDPTGTAEVVSDPWVPLSTMTLRHGSFQSGPVAFANTYNETYYSWNDFAYSNEIDTTTPDYTNQYSVISGSGAGDGQDNFGVGYGYSDASSPFDVPSLTLTDPEFQFDSVMVNNTTYVYLTMRDGYYNASPFGYRDNNGDGDYDDVGDIAGDYADWFLLTVNGADASGTILSETVEFYLADYRSSDNSQDYIVDEWTEVDLTPLADASTLYFNLSSSDVGTYGMNTPSYFAIDNLTLTATPEPSTIVLLLTAVAAGAVAWRRRRARATAN